MNYADQYKAALIKSLMPGSNQQNRHWLETVGNIGRTAAGAYLSKQMAEGLKARQQKANAAIMGAMQPQTVTQNLQVQAPAAISGSQAGAMGGSPVGEPGERPGFNVPVQTPKPASPMGMLAALGEHGADASPELKQYALSQMAPKKPEKAQIFGDQKNGYFALWADGRKTQLTNGAGEPKTAMQKNLEAAGILPGTKLYKDAMLKWVERGTNVDVDVTNGPDNSKGLAQAQKDFAGLATEQVSKATSARGMLADIGGMRGLFESGLQSGFGQNWINQVARIRGLFDENTDMSQVEMAEILRSDINRLVAPAVKQLGTNPTDRDLQFIVDIFPNIENTLEGNMAVLAALELSAQRDLAIADFTTSWMTKNREKMVSDPLAMIDLQGDLADFMAESELWSAERRNQIREAAVQAAKASKPAAPAAPAAPDVAEPDRLGGIFDKLFGN